MSTPNNNPFVLPGMGQHSDLSGNPLMASMEMMRQAWAGLTGPGGLAQSLPMTPPMNLEDLERRISELRSVEGWLRMNLSMLSSTIQGMEVQRSTIATLRSFADSLSSTDRTSGDTPASPLEVVLGLRPAPKTQAKSGAASAPHQPSGAASTGSGSDTPQSGGAAAGGFPGFGGLGQSGATVGAGTGAPGGDAGNRSDQAWSQAAGDAAAQASQAAAQAGQAAAQATGQAAGDATAQTSNAAQAWWDMLQQQFSNIAAATAASMPQTAGTKPAGAAAGRASAATSAGTKASGSKPGGQPSSNARAAAGTGAVPSASPRGTTKSAGAKPAGAKPAAAKKGAAKSASAAKRAPAARKATARKAGANKTS